MYYFDWTASGLAAYCVEKRIQNILPFYANTHSESSKHSEIMGRIYQNSRAIISKSFGLDESYALISCGFGSSSAIKKFQEIMGIYIPPKTKQVFSSALKSLELPLVIVGPFEHHSNELSFREGLCEVVRIPLNELGLVDLEFLESTLKQNAGRKIIASFALVSNVSGIIAPFVEISNLVRSYGGIMCYDMASSSAYFDIPCDFYDVAFLSPHKLLGGVCSSGVLIIKRALIDKTLSPTFCGGGVVGYVSRTSARYFADEEVREEAGTPGILEFIRGGLAYLLRDEIDKQWILEYKEEIARSFKEFLGNEKNIISYGNLDYNALGIFSFNIINKSPYEMAKILSQEYGILLRAGCSCAGPYGHDLLGLEDNQTFLQKPGWIRVSLHYTHTYKDIKYLCNVLKRLCR
ncbi:aminotransferase class V-fold PLP-dependent enzyme [Helicobacter mesocricetorum]|uniref:aminotransferase class V-fold PLP-dependent enzyme n=1 Tax=Helicobacter mesocricetorum TaxID=87012 RepID=UPI001F18EA64|nr:aminotransferase class V-fold PLP-dependent enzyme [Helicobacter mesocricetorum]